MNFGSWLIEEELRGNIVISSKESIKTFPKDIYKYIGYSINPIVNVLFSRLPWEHTLQLMLLIFNKTKIDTNIPLTRYQTKKEKIEEISWNYNGRMKHYLIHILAKTYGWDDTYIKKLSVDTALSYIQEIFVDDQLDKEFTHSLSEIAYVYNKNTKKSEFKPLSRPVWMQKEIKEVKKIKMLRSMLPVGNVQDVSGMEKYFNESQEADPK